MIFRCVFPSVPVSQSSLQAADAASDIKTVSTRLKAIAKELTTLAATADKAQTELAKAQAAAKVAAAKAAAAKAAAAKPAAKAAAKAAAAKAGQ